MKKLLQFSASALLVCATASSAATIAGYDFTGGSSLEASQFGSNVIAGAVELNDSETSMGLNSDRGDNTGTTAGISFSTAAGSIIAGNGNLKTSSRDAAITDGDFFSFTIAPEAGFELDLDTIVFSAARAFDVNRSAESFALMSSITGFETTDTSLLTGAITTVEVGVGAYQQFSLDVSENSLFQNITTSTEFRIYMWGGTGSGSQAAIQYDNIGVTGDVLAIPEPASFAAFLGLGSLALILRRRQ